MNLNQLKLFHTIVTEGSFTNAAKKLYISQPAVSSQLKKFEAELELKLFDKKGTKNILNENGQLLYQYTQKIFKLITEVENELKDHKEQIGGTVYIGGGNTAGTYILPKIIGTFKKMYPNVNVSLHVSDTSEIAEMICENQLDFAVNGGTVFLKANMEDQLLFYDELVLCASPASSLAEQPLQSLDALYKESFIMHEPNSQLFAYTERLLKQLNIAHSVSMQLGNIEAMKQAVEAELGVAFIPKTAVCYELKVGLLKEIKLPSATFFYPQSILYNKARYLNPAAKLLKEMVQVQLWDEGVKEQKIL